MQNVNILGGHSIGHSKQKSVYMSSHELQSALMVTVEFSKMYLLYEVSCTDFVTWTINTHIRNSSEYLRAYGSVVGSGTML
jgi:hypothetical protein